MRLPHITKNEKEIKNTRRNCGATEDGSIFFLHRKARVRLY